ncbi:MAG: hypothetical protein SGARI_008143, partial [Bacillariaceae sp.]
MADEQEQRPCTQCSKTLAQGEFSKSQWKKGRGNGRCLACVGDNSTANGANGKKSFLLMAPQQSKPKKSAAVVPSVSTLKPSTMSASTLIIRPRPQMAVPGFDNLTVCSDWPQTKRGEPPAKQTAIFMPLLACVIGPVAGHCTATQLEHAMQWWTQALPAWPRWVEALKKAGVAQQMRERLLKSARGQPTRLIPKVIQGSHGTIPH